LTGASTLAAGDVSVLLFDPELESWPGSIVLPISFASAVIGTEIETGRDDAPPSGSVLGVGEDAGGVSAGPLDGGFVT
jgi:hypothetical protein